ncbi:MAG: hypothetical protein IT531_00080 [Burkholderiales bacterium]|nr:hypothetical protein [Burkholderiales bacterium]
MLMNGPERISVNPHAQPQRLSSVSAFQASLLNHATSSYLFCGADPIDSRVFIRDDTGGILRQATTTDGWATTANFSVSTSKGLPTTPNAVLYSGVVKIIRFGASLYLLSKDSVTNLYGVYRAAPASGNTAFSWSAPLKQMTDASATALYPCFSADATYMYLAEYGDPTGGPTVWRSADGDTWTQIYTEVGQGTPMRHAHAIAPDPHNAGHLWMTLGDGNANRTVLRSTDYGDTWSTFEVSASWQAVQISFSQQYIYFAGDSQRGHVWVVDRRNTQKYWVCAGLAKNMGVPAAAASTDSFYANGYFGVVDPATDEYYFSLINDGAGGNTPGLFFVPFHGAAPVLLDKLASNATPVDIFQGFLWYGKSRRPVHST